jgi:phosphopantetheinyl transferase
VKKSDGIIYYCEIPEHLSKDASRFAREMLKWGFREFFQVDFQEEKIGRMEHGKPFYQEGEHLHFNISHCKDGVAVAVSNRQIGVDVESMRSVNVRTVKKCCTKEECAYVFQNRINEGENNLPEDEAKRFLELWTLKESYVKLTGEGLREPFSQVCFPFLQTSETKKQCVREIAGEDTANRHYLYAAGKLILAMSVRWEDAGRNPAFHWKEIAFPL